MIKIVLFTVDLSTHLYPLREGTQNFEIHSTYKNENFAFHLSTLFAEIR